MALASELVRAYGQEQEQLVSRPIEGPRIMSRRAIFFAALTICFSLTLGAPADARGDLGVDHDACVLKVGPELMYFAGYQPGGSRIKFCEDVPEVGETIFVFDYVEPELREMKADFRILRQSPEADDPDNLESATAAYLPPQIYPKGTFSFEHVFTQPGDYVGIVTVEGAQGERWMSRFPFSVGKHRFEFTPYYLIAAAAALGLLLFVSNRVGRAHVRGGPTARR